MRMAGCGLTARALARVRKSHKSLTKPKKRISVYSYFTNKEKKCHFFQAEVLEKSG